MSRWKNNGGWNKRNGTVERVPRIDSYEVPTAGEWDGVLFACKADGTPALTLDCERYTEYGPTEAGDQEFVEVWHPKDGWSMALELSHKVNGYGGEQTFFLCPACGGRVRYLYQVGSTFLCRKCARLNYRSQQETRSDSLYYYHRGMELVEKHLNHWSLVHPDGFSFCDWVPNRPRYMHETTYRRYLARFLRYRKKHANRQIEDMARILRSFK